jgi:hypothetical protein
MTAEAPPAMGEGEVTAATTASTPVRIPVPTPAAVLPLVTPTLTPRPSAPTPKSPTTPPPTPTPTVESLASYDLLIAKRGEESLFVVNWAAEAFPLAPLRLGDGTGAINGTDWGIELLGSSACVAAWRDKGEPRPPRGQTCDPIGERLTRGGRDLFWKETFDVYYGEEWVGICEKEQQECSISIPTGASYHILIAKRDEEGMFVVNRTAEAFPLEPLRLGDDGDEGVVYGADWGIDVLEKDACVTVWKDENEPRPPDELECNRVGERLVRRDKDERFWRSAFNVYYGEEKVGTCEKQQENCVVNLTRRD